MVFPRIGRKPSLSGAFVFAGGLTPTSHVGDIAREADMTATLDEIAQAIVADGRGVLAADETPTTLTKRLTALGIQSTPESRRDYREMLFTTPGISEYIGGVILQDETIHQNGS